MRQPLRRYPANLTHECRLRGIAGGFLFVATQRTAPSVAALFHPSLVCARGVRPDTREREADPGGANDLDQPMMFTVAKRGGVMAHLDHSRIHTVSPYTV